MEVVGAGFGSHDSEDVLDGRAGESIAIHSTVMVLQSSFDRRWLSGGTVSALTVDSCFLNLFEAI